MDMVFFQVVDGKFLEDRLDVNCVDSLLDDFGALPQGISFGSRKGLP
jgi:hypothetical protein